MGTSGSSCTSCWYINYVGESVFCMYTQWNARRINSFGGNSFGENRESQMSAELPEEIVRSMSKTETHAIFIQRPRSFESSLKCLRNTKLCKFAHACCVYLRQDTCLHQQSENMIKLENKFIYLQFLSSHSSGILTTKDIYKTFISSCPYFFP